VRLEHCRCCVPLVTLSIWFTNVITASSVLPTAIQGGFQFDSMCSPGMQSSSLVVVLSAARSWVSQYGAEGTIFRGWVGAIRSDHRPLFSVVQPSSSPGPGVKSPWSPFGRRLRRLCGSPWPDSHFGKVLRRVGEGSRLRLISQGVPVDYGVPKNGGGSFSMGVASLWHPVRFLRRK
jgi:hypothetical protein